MIKQNLGIRICLILANFTQTTCLLIRILHKKTSNKKRNLHNRRTFCEIQGCKWVFEISRDYYWV